MAIVLAFAVVLLLAVLVSGWSQRSILSTSVLFLLAGFLIGKDTLGFTGFSEGSRVLSALAEWTLFSVLFNDSMKVGLRDLAAVWKLPGRALFIGMPLTLLFTAVLGHYVAGLTWLEASLVGAVLMPTDPVFAAAIVRQRAVPQPLRRLLNVESGLNDGLALPVVLVLLSVMGAQHAEIGHLLARLGEGVALGAGVTWLAARLEGWKIFELSTRYQPLFSVAVGLLVFALAKLLHANEFLAAFASGATLATLRPDLRDAFHEFGELLTELLKLATLLIFGALISWPFLRGLSWQSYLFVLLALLLARPAALNLALLGSPLSRSERLTASWFGPKGFASVLYGILLLKAGIKDAQYLFHLIALVIAASIIAHASTDTLIARWFREAKAG
jgi:NhaP-type Na+/H+ or K+/H+ antiporter